MRLLFPSSSSSCNLKIDIFGLVQELYIHSYIYNANNGFKKKGILTEWHYNSMNVTNKGELKLISIPILMAHLFVYYYYLLLLVINKCEYTCLCYIIFIHYI